MAYNPKFEVDLSRIFNRAYADRSSKFRDALRPILSNRSFRAAYGKRIVDRIIERTLDGIDRNGVRFTAYSKTYRDSDVFKIYQKNPGEVNLKLTGEMLASLKTGGNGPILRVDLIGSENKAKAHGHVNGIRTRGGGKVKRDFLGLPDEELESIMIDTIGLIRNEFVNDATEFFENTSLADIFGTVGTQAELVLPVLTPEVIALLSQDLI